MKKIKVLFECLTPIFIGSGQQIDYINIMPYQYDVSNDLESKALYKIYPENVSQKEITAKFLELIKTHKAFLIPEIYGQFIEKYHLEKRVLGDTFDEDIFKKIEDNKNLNTIRNQIFIHLFCKGNKGVYVPGSSIKGMLKTPYIKNNHRYFKNDGSAKDIETDPFNNFLVRDFHHHQMKVHVGNIEVKNFPKKPLKDHFERNPSSIPCYCQYLAPGSFFECEIQDNLKSSYTFEQTHEFYLSAFKKLKDQVYQKDNDLSDAFEVKINQIDPLKKEFLISLGGYGGVWTKKCLGNDKFRRPQDKKNVSNKSSFRKSVCFKMPIGWCKGTWQEA